MPMIIDRDTYPNQDLSLISISRLLKGNFHMTKTNAVFLTGRALPAVIPLNCGNVNPGTIAMSATEMASGIAHVTILKGQGGGEIT